MNPKPYRTAVFTVLTALLLLTFGSMAIASTIRTISGSGTCTGSITLSVTPGTSAKSVSIEEFLYGAIPSNISNNGVWNPMTGVIKWGVFTDNTNRTLTYTISGSDGSYPLNGFESIDGKSLAITGDGEVEINCRVATPTISPSSGTVPVTVTLSCATTGAEIHYTTNGSTPISTSALYSSPLNITSGTTLRVAAFKTGLKSSVIVSAYYAEPPREPLAAITRTLSDNDGCAPNVSISVTPETSVKSWAFEENIPNGLSPSGISHSGVWVASRRIIRWGTFTDGTARNLNYSLSGDDGTFSVSGEGSFNGFTDAAQGDADVILNCPVMQVETPVFNPPDGTGLPVTVSMTCATTGAEIHYTTDGSEPNANSPVYSAPLNFTTKTNLKAIALKSGMTQSAVASATYSETSSNPAEIVRSIENDATCNPQIELTITPVANVKSWAVEEILPEGVTPSNISHEGVWNNAKRSIRWGVFLDGTTRTLSYTVTGAALSYPINGTASVNGASVPITGIVEASVDCASEKVAEPVFDPPTGTKSPGSVAITSETPGASIYYTDDGSEPTQAATLYSGPVSVSQTVTIKAKAFKIDMIDSDTAEAYYPVRVPKAIIVAGGGPYAGNDFWQTTLTVSKIAYRMLLYAGYLKDNIYYLSSEQDIDVDGNGDPEDDIDDDASSNTLSYAVNTWAKDASDLVLFLVDHGLPGMFLINGVVSPDDFLKASTLDVWLDDLQKTMPGRVILIYEACHSGSFLPLLLPEPNKERIIIASSLSEQKSTYADNGVTNFAYQFWNSFISSTKIHTAFTRAKSIVDTFQAPIIDANGDGLYIEKQDLQLIGDLTIGRQIGTAALFPTILYKSDDQVLNGATTAEIKAGNISPPDFITRVWAVIMPPSVITRPEGEPILDLPSVELEDSNGDGIYTGTFNDFTEKGIYKINVYALDQFGSYAVPVQINIDQQVGETFIVKGDINGDNRVGIEDVIIALRVVAGIRTDAAIRSDYADVDVNGDYTIGLVEAIYGMRKAAGY